MTGNQLGDAGAVALARAIRYHPKLSDLNVSGNKSIGDVGVQALADAMSANFTVDRKILECVGTGFVVRQEGKADTPACLSALIVHGLETRVPKR